MTISPTQRKVIDRIVRGFMVESATGGTIKRTMQNAYGYVTAQINETIATTPDRAERLGVDFLSRSDLRAVMEVIYDEIQASII